jgi:DNA ligase-1
MKWIEFSRLNQVIEGLTPTRKIRILAKDYPEEYISFIEILALELPVNNLASKKAMKWITNVLEVFDDEVEGAIYIHGDIGEAMYHFTEDANDSDFNLQTVITFLSMDCSKSDGKSFQIFRNAFSAMSALEKKWFLRYWLRTPRNGINAGLVKKLLAKVYDKKVAEITKHHQLHSLSDIAMYYGKEQTPPNDLKVGRFIAPMLAKVVPKEKWPPRFIIEYKYDGARYQIHKGDTVIIFNRKGKVVTGKFPDMVELVNSWDISEPFIIDTEIYPIENDGRPAPFKKMGTRIHSKNIQEAIEKCPVELGVFDCMMFNGENLMDLSFEQRLTTINKFPKLTERTPQMQHHIFYNLAINDGYEGIMIKDLDAPYESGKRSTAWAKHKPPRFELDVVVTGVRYGEGKRATVFSSYDIAVKDKNDLLSIGSVGTGFSEIDLIYLTNEARKIILSVDNGTHILSPRIVLEVTCDLITTDSEGNLGLRFPRLLRIRHDKPVSDINTLEDIQNMV